MSQARTLAIRSNRPVEVSSTQNVKTSVCEELSGIGSRWQYREEYRLIVANVGGQPMEDTIILRDWSAAWSLQDRLYGTHDAYSSDGTLPIRLDKYETRVFCLERVGEAVPEMELAG